MAPAIPTLSYYLFALQGYLRAPAIYQDATGRDTVQKEQRAPPTSNLHNAKEKMIKKNRRVEGN